MFSAQNSQVSSAANYIEDMFSTYLYNGNSTTQTITNGIDLAGKGGLVWTKARSAADGSVLIDSVQGRGKYLTSVNTNGAANANSTQNITAFNSNGYALGTNESGATTLNTNAVTYASWTFREQPKFFDIVTWTGNGASNRLITHALGAIPAIIMIKATSTTGSWYVNIRSSGLNGDTSDFANVGLGLESTSGRDSSFLGTSQATAWTSTQFTLYSTGARTNVSSVTYVAYLFAHNAGGFGLTGTDNVISCGTYTGNSTTNSINLGYEPQWLLIKRTTVAVSDWILLDVMRGLTVGTSNAALCPNNANAEGATVSVSNAIRPTATGFDLLNANSALNVSGSSYIYVAIRRGPMAVPTLGTTVFGISARTGTGANATVTGGSGVDDAVIIKNRGAAVADLYSSRLTGTGYLVTSTTAAEVAAGTTILQANPWDVMDGVKVGTTSTITNASANTFVNYLFSRAPGFFDVVCYTGTGVARTVAHNLTVVPELMIIKLRSAAGGSWPVYHVSLGPSSGPSLTYANAAYWGGSSNLNSTTPTNSVFTVGTDTETNDSGKTYISYLFATCPGVSKVGSYTGNGTTQTIDCGLTSGARFVLIKRTDATGDWYVYDTARGMTVLTNPYLRLNSIAIETATLGSVTTVSTGFALNSTILAAINVNAGTYIFLAIA